ncbi:major facilitator superfamily protein [Cavenderia fasciculata]|uniref:Major facilitator superfamily protein n=1 Tax=Cavenderia fasciculata TaxID=261658 RepID=F4PQM6_CACFS|nr:major facilitator superfamily protein [Cavenderia fasciculata]EGG21193.1 major facilitator superfamily protein [Cavenderia fasciculata]|eukprot:XP_004359043.1 major facilitator superfamily protein [Cavenderia fasciculata]
MNNEEDNEKSLLTRSEEHDDDVITDINLNTPSVTLTYSLTEEGDQDNNNGDISGAPLSPLNISSITSSSSSHHSKQHKGNSYVKLTNHDSLLSSPIISDSHSSSSSSFFQKQISFLTRVQRTLVAGTGFLCDAYDLFVINLVIVILETLYGDFKSSKSVVSTAALWGAVTGQLVFGFVADRVGRRTGFIITLSFIIVGAFGSILSFNVSDGFNIFIMLALWRALLGFGIGGEYPLSATISSETCEDYHWRTLVGTAGGWFIFDITFYANGLFNATIVSVLNFDNAATPYDKILNTVTISIYLALLGLPGYFVGVFLIDRIGRRTLQLAGFFCLGLTYLIMGITFQWIVKIKWLFIILYGLTFFFSNAGPNTTTFVLPSESFPTRIRATCHGFSAACGKIGAVVGGAAISPFFEAYGLGNTLIVCAGLALSGMVLTYFFVKETMGIEMQEDIEMTPIPPSSSAEDLTLPSSSLTTDQLVKNYSTSDISTQGNKSLSNSLDSDIINLTTKEMEKEKPAAIMNL